MYIYVHVHYMYTCDFIVKVQRVHMCCIFHGHLEGELVYWY